MLNFQFAHRRHPYTSFDYNLGLPRTNNAWLLVPVFRMAAHERTPLLPPPSDVSRQGPASHADSEVKTETAASFGAPAIPVALFGPYRSSPMHPLRLMF